MNAAKAEIFIKHDGKLEELAVSLQQALCLPEFWFKSDQEPPHEVTAMSECLGFELWLYASNQENECNYTLKLESSVRIQDHESTKFHDMSIWLAQHIEIVSSVHVEV